MIPALTLKGFPFLNSAMFGFSLPKLIVLAAIVAGIWYVFKFIGRRTGPKVKDKSPGANGGPEAVDMNKCAVCGDYLSAEAPSGCGRSDCPYPGS